MNKFSEFINWIVVVLFAIVFVSSALSGCSSYKFGDASRLYCGITSTESREVIKAEMIATGVDVGIDYCTSVGLLDAALNRTG